MSVIKLFDDPEFQYGVELALGATYRQAADVGEVLTTAERIAEGDSDSWVGEWERLGSSVLASAVASERDGRRVNALSQHRRAATYYATALYRVESCSEPSRGLELWRRQQQCWERIVDLSDPPGEHMSIPYEGTSLPGYFFRAPGAGRSERRPLVILNNGSDGATSQMWLYGGAAASERGYHWMTFDGPGQQSTLFERGIPFRFDWEAVLTPVLDAALSREDVDTDRVAVIGVSQAGYWVPRALAYEHRFAAAAVDPGVVDVLRSWLAHLPEAMRKQLREEDRSAFDREMELVSLMAPEAAATLRFRGRPYGEHGGSLFALFRSVQAYQLNGEIDRIRTPLLVTDPDDEQFWPGQSRELYERLSAPKALAPFSSADGAGGHCEPLAAAARDERVFDWLAGYLDE